MKRVRRPLLLVLVLLTAPGCLVLSLNPWHERDALVFLPELVGEWTNTDDNVTVTVRADEWQSYEIEYAHPIEKGRLTGHLTRIGKATYLDVMPARGEDRGSFLLPVHAVLRLTLEGDRLEVRGLSYDWFFDRIRKKVAIPGLIVVQDEKENAVIGSATAAARAWLGKQPDGGAMFGAVATFTRVRRER